MAEGTQSSSTVQLVRAAEPGAQRATRLGIGLLVSLVVGWPALAGALRGGDHFEGSVLRFVVSVAVSVAGVLLLGALYDHFLAAARRRPRPGTTGGAPTGTGAEVGR